MNDIIRTLVNYSCGIENGTFLAVAAFLYVDLNHTKRDRKLIALFANSVLYFAFISLTYHLVVYTLGKLELFPLMSLFSLTNIPVIVQIVFHITRVQRFHWRSFIPHYAGSLMLMVIYTLHPTLSCYFTLSALYIPYGLWFLWIVRKGVLHYRKGLKENYSDSRADLSWLHSFTIGFVIWTISSLIIFINPVIHVICYSLLSAVMIAWLCSLVWRLSPPRYVQFLYEKEEEVTEEVQESLPVAAASEPVDTSLMTTGATQKTTQLIHDRLMSLTEEGEFYKNPNITCAQLAEMVGTNRRYLSDYINKVLGKTFYVYVNDLRLENAQRLIKAGRMDLEEVAEESGFASLHRLECAFLDRHQFTLAQYIQVKDSLI